MKYAGPFAIERVSVKSVQRLEHLRARHVGRKMQVLRGLIENIANALSGHPTQELIAELAIQQRPGRLRVCLGSEVGRAVIDENGKRRVRLCEITPERAALFQKLG